MNGEGHSSMTFWWRRWIEHSRSPRCTHAAVPIAQDLELDVARPLDVLLEVDGGVAKEAAASLRARSNAPRGPPRMDDADALPPPPPAALIITG
jgi:hypothetical protein